MAMRKRTIQPDIWQDADFGSISSLAQLIFVGCITQADDEGRLNGHPAVIRSSLFPYGFISLEEVFDALQELSIKMRNFVYYTVNDQFYIQLLNWNKHQKQKAERIVSSTFPSPPKELLSGRRRADGGQMASQVSKEVSKQVSKDAAVRGGAVINILDGLRKELEIKGIIKTKKLL